MFGRMIILKLAVGKIPIIKQSRIWLNPHIFKLSQLVIIIIIISFQMSK